MAILRNDTTVRSADGQTTSPIITAANIGNYGISTTSTYYIGTTQNVFNRASGAQTLTGVSIDGNAATVTNGVYTTGTQSISGAKTFNDASTFGSNVTLTGTSQLFIGSYMSLQSSATILGMVGFNRKVSDGTIFNSSYAAYQLHNDTGTLNLQIYTSAGAFVGAHTFNSSGNITFIGSTTSSTDLRAPVFYDSNNTSYYLDPNASTSGNLFGVLKQNDGKFVRDSYFRTISGIGDYYASGASGWYTVASITLTTNCTGGVLYGTLYDNRYDGADTYQIAIVARAECDFTTNNESHYVNVGCTILGSTGITNYQSKIRVLLVASSANSRTYEVQFFETSWNRDTWQLETGGSPVWTIYSTAQAPGTSTGTARVFYVSNKNADNIRANTASYSPIYYDSNDTSYYLDAAGTSRLNTTRIGNINVGSGTYLNTITPIGDTNINLSSPSGAFYFDAFPRMPGFYDSANTAYYIDPASTSIVNSFKVYDALYFGDYTTYLSQATPYLRITTANGYGNFGPANSSWFHMTTDRPNFYMAVGLHINGDLFIYNTQSQLTSTSVRAPIFYDSGDTTYYLDPANTGTALAIAGNAGVGTASPTLSSGKGIHINSSSGHANLKLQSSGRTWELLSTTGAYFSVYDTTGGADRLTVTSGGNVGVATTAADTNLQVVGHVHVGNQTTFDNTGGWNKTIYLDGTVHARMRIIGSAFASGKNSQTETNIWVDNSVAPYSGLTTNAGSFTINAGFTTLTNSARSPIFYDSDNTAYYIDAASTSNLNVLVVAASARVGGAASRSTSGLTVGFTDNSTFAANTDVGDTDRMLSIVNESSTTNAMSVLGFRVNPNGGTTNAMMDIKFVQTGATNTSALYYTFNHGGTFADRLTIQSSGNIGVNTSDFSYTSSDNSRLVGSNTSNRLFVNGSIQLLNNNDAIVIGRGTATFLSDEELGFGWGGGWYMTDGTYLRVRNDKVLYTAGEIWGSIFKDSNDTTYYIDPASTSRLVALWVRGSSETVGNIYVGGTAAGDRLNINYDQIWTPNGNLHLQYSGGGNIDMNYGGGFTFSRTSLRAPIFYDYNDTTYYTDPSSFSLISSLGIGGLTSSNNVQMYDSYVDASSSYLQSPPLIIRKDSSATGAIDQAPVGLFIYNLNGTNNTWTKLSMGSREAAGAGNTVSIAGLAAQKTAGTANNWATGNLHFWTKAGGTQITNMVAYSAGYVQSDYSFRSPIFYDSNNTSYYLDPASTSNLNVVNLVGITGAGNAYIQTTSTGTSYTSHFQIREASGGGGNTSETYAPALGFHWSGVVASNILMESSGRIAIRNNPGSGYENFIANAIYGAVFYDSNDVTYYTDPSSLSNILELKTNKNWYDSSASAWGGGINMGGNNPTIGFQSTSSTWWYMLHHASSNINFYRRSTSGSWNHDGIWDSSGNFIWQGSSVRAPIFYDQNNTAYYTDPASTSVLNRIDLPSGSAVINTTTPGTSAYQLNFTGQGTADNAQAITWGWSTSGAQAGIYVQSSGAYGTKMYIATTDSFATGSKTALTIDHTGVVTTNRNYLQATGSLRAPIFYDSDNTAYYIDAASTSNLNVLNAVSSTTLWVRSGSWAGDLTSNGFTREIGMQMTGGSEFVILSKSGQGYTLVDGSYYAYEAGGFYSSFNSSYGAIVGFSADSTSSVTFNCNVKAPIYYDSNNTSYYLDPNSASNLNNVTVAGTLTLTNIAKNSTAPIVINSGQSASLGLRVYYDMNLYNTLTFTDSAWNSQGSIFGSSSVVTINAATATTSFVKYAGYSQEGGSFRAPIFYDSNDTNYYVDPNGNSVLNGLYVNAYYNLANNYKDIYVYGDVNTYYVVLIQGEYLYSYGRYSVTRGYNWTGPDTWYTSTHKGGLTLDWEYSGDTAWGGNDQNIRIIEFYETYSTMVAGFALPVNGGVIVWLRGGGVNGALYRIRTPIGANSTVTVYDGITATNHSSSTSFTAANSAVFSTRANTSNVASEINSRFPVRYAGTLYNDGNAVLDQSGTSQTKSGILSSAASLRAPIFYDTDNTGYYIDPNGASSINTITSAQYYTTGWFRNNSSGNGLYNESTGQHFYSDSANYWNVASSAGAQGIRLRTGGHNGTVRGYFYADTNNDVGFLNQDGSWRLRVVGGDYALADGSSMRAQIFYDSNDTNYYVDPAGTSYLNYSIFNGLSSADYTRQFAPSGGYFYAGGAQTGAIKIRMPANSKALYPMLSFTCHIYNYSTGTSRTFKIGGHFSNSSWYNPFAYCLSESAGNLNVRWGYEGNYLVVWIGETSSGWSYPCVFITDFQNGYSAINNSWMTGWNVSLVTAFDTITNGPTAAGFFWNQNNDGSGSGLDADLVDGLEVHTARNDNANKIVRTDSNGYIQAGWINTTSGDNGTNALDRIYASSDAYIRYYTPANFRTVLDVPTRGGSGASGSWGISITGSSASCTGNSATATTASSCSGNSATATTATNAGCITSDTGNVGDSRLQYWQTSGNTTLNPDTEWYNAIRMGHGNPVTYYSNTLAVKMTGSNLGDIYTRTTTNGTAGTWNRFWNNNNDGAGSGLDADLLDGINSASFLRSDVSATNSVDLRSPIYYDSDNTTYYINAGGISNLLGLTVVNTITGNISGNAGTVSAGVYTNTNQNITGEKYFQSNLGTTSGSLSSPPLQVYSTGTNAAFMSFHRAGNYAVNMGLDSDNVLRIGGWSASANRLQLDMSGNLTLAGVVDATQFRDSANTAYYVDPASTSILNLVRTRNTFGERITVTSAASTTIDTNFNVTELTMSASITTLTLSNIQANTIVHMWTIVTVGNGTAYSITWPAAVKWPGGTAPTITSTNTKRDIYQFVTYDGGTNIYAIIVGQNL